MMSAVPTADGRIEDRVEKDRIDVRFSMSVVDLFELPPLLLFAIEQLDHRHSGYVFLEKGVDAGDSHADFTERAAGAEPEPRGQSHEKRHDRKRDQGQPPVDLEHPDDNVEDHRKVAEYDDHSGREHLVERVDVGSQSGHQPAYRIAIVELDGEALKVREDLAPEVIHYVLAHRLHHDCLSVQNAKRREVSQQQDERYECYARIGASSKSQPLAGLFQEKSKGRGRVCLVGRQEQVDRRFSERRPGEN
jgi:hypothetical protein